MGMTTYTVTIERPARKALDRIERPTRRRIETTITALATNPRPNGCTKLTATNAYRVRVGDYRIVYTIDDTIKIVDVTNIGHRSSIYKEA